MFILRKSKFSKSGQENINRIIL